MTTFKAVTECCICLGGEEEAHWVALDCGHVFHLLCITQCLEHKKECPQCRKRHRGRPLQLFLSGAVQGASSDEAGNLILRKQAEVLELQQRVQQLHQQHEAAQAQQAQQLLGALLELQQTQARVERLQARNHDLKTSLADVSSGRDSLQAQLLGVREQAERDRERAKTELARLTGELRTQRASVSRLQRSLTLVQLSHPRMTDASSIQELAGSCEGGAAFSALLAARNQELATAQREAAEAEARCGAAERDAAARVEGVRQEAARQVEAAVAERDGARRQQLQLELQMTALQREVAELQGVLDALQGGDGKDSSRRGLPWGMHGQQRWQPGRQAQPKRQPVVGGQQLRDRTPVDGAVLAGTAGRQAGGSPAASGMAGAAATTGLEGRDDEWWLMDVVPETQVPSQGAGGQGGSGPLNPGGSDQRHAVAARAARPLQQQQRAAAAGRQGQDCSQDGQGVSGNGSRSTASRGTTHDEGGDRRGAGGSLAAGAGSPGQPSAGGRFLAGVGTTNAPSFLGRVAATLAAPSGARPTNTGGQANGSFIRDGPDGRGGRARHLMPITNQHKRATPPGGLSDAAKKPKAASGTAKHSYWAGKPTATTPKISQFFASK